MNVNDSHVFGPLFGINASALGVSDFQNVPIRTTNVAIHHEHIFNSRFLNEFLAGMQRWADQSISDTPYPLVSGDSTDDRAWNARALKGKQHKLPDRRFDELYARSA